MEKIPHILFSVASSEIKPSDGRILNSLCDLSFLCVLYPIFSSYLFYILFFHTYHVYFSYYVKLGQADFLASFQANNSTITLSAYCNSSCLRENLLAPEALENLTCDGRLWPIIGHFREVASLLIQISVNVLSDC